MILEKLGYKRTYEFCIEGETNQGYPFAETGLVVASDFDNAVHAVRKLMAARNLMRVKHELTGLYTEITELTMVRRNSDGK